MVHGDNHRLYLDIEIEYKEEPSKQAMHQVIGKSLLCVQRKLVELNGGQHDERFCDVTLSTNHRWKKKENMFYLSAHATFPQVLFEHNIGMKMFIQEVV